MESGNVQEIKNKNYEQKSKMKSNYHHKKGYYKGNYPNQKEKLDPYTIQMMIYKAEMYILMKYPFLIDINKKYSPNIIKIVSYL